MQIIHIGGESYTAMMDMRHMLVRNLKQRTLQIAENEVQDTVT